MTYANRVRHRRRRRKQLDPVRLRASAERAIARGERRDGASKPSRAQVIHRAYHRRKAGAW